MRRVILLLAMAAILALPGLALAQPTVVPTYADVDLKAGDHGTGGVAALSAPPNTAGTMDLWMYVTSDGDLDGLQWDIEVNGVNNQTLFSHDAMAAPSADLYPPYNAQTAGFGEVFSASDGTKWATGDFTASANPFDNAASEYIFRTGFTDVAHLSDATVIGYEISWTAALPADDYTFSIESKWTSQDAMGDPLEGSLGGDDFVLTITPEPATALLLLGALPIMRRRR